MSYFYKKDLEVLVRNEKTGQLDKVVQKDQLFFHQDQPSHNLVIDCLAEEKHKKDYPKELAAFEASEKKDLVVAKLLEVEASEKKDLIVAKLLQVVEKSE